ncbi:MAG TPA: hypothetical protein VKZ53_29575 [Candidatus Angelobacter sp.]|nr:hypothetical protein [Candidatus Angelobacter sp.]
MKTWQIFAVGVVGLVLAFFFPAYQSKLAAAGAGFVIALIAFGCFLRPRREIYYVSTVAHFHDPDDEISIERGCVAVKVEQVRLWLLLVPAILAEAFLIGAFVRGTVWRISLIDIYWQSPMFALALRVGVMFTISILSTWMSERWVFRDANATMVKTISVHNGRVMYSFIDDQGEYYGGMDFRVGLPPPVELAWIVFYNIPKPHLNKIGLGLLFHRLVIVGHGATDLGEATVAAQALTGEAMP